MIVINTGTVLVVCWWWWSFEDDYCDFYDDGFHDDGFHDDGFHDDDAAPGKLRQKSRVSDDKSQCQELQWNCTNCIADDADDDDADADDDGGDNGDDHDLDHDDEDDGKI